MKNLFKIGFISIEIVIIASVCLIGGLAGTSSFLKNGQSSQARSATAINNTIESINEDFGFSVGEIPDIEAETEMKWFYGEHTFPELPKEVTEKYSYYFIGEAFGYTAMMGTSTMPKFGFYSGHIYNEPTGTDGYYEGDFLQWGDEENGEYDAYFLIDGSWVHYVHDEWDGNYIMVDVSDIYWTNHNLLKTDNSVYLQGVEAELKEVPINQ